MPVASRYELHSVRPDLILLRVTARNLILWDAVQPTEAWLTSQLPNLPPPPTGQQHTYGPSVAADPEALRLARANSVAGACLALGLRFAGSCCAPACDLLYEQVGAVHGAWCMCMEGACACACATSSTSR